PLLRVDVEVILPEVDHHLLQLPLAVDGAQYARGVKLVHDALRILQTVLAHVLDNGLTVRAPLRVNVLRLLLRGLRIVLRIQRLADELLGVGTRAVRGVRRFILRRFILHRLVVLRLRLRLLSLLSLLYERGEFGRELPAALQASEYLVGLRVAREKLAGG